jgi:hypothetical protein
MNGLFSPPRFRLPFTAALLLGMLGSALPAQELVIPDGVSCPACGLELRRIAVLGTADGPGALDGEPSSVRRDGDGRYFVTQFVVFNAIQIFDQSGRHIRTVGREGAGPGEFRGIAAADVHADSLFVFDNGNVRLSVFTPDLTLARTERLHGAMTYRGVVLSDGAVVINAVVPTSEGVGFPLHLLRDGAAPVSFGSVDGGALVSPSPVPLMRAVAATRDGGVWATPRTRYEVDRWNAQGEWMGRLVRRAGWFTPYTNRTVGGNEPPEPFLFAVREIAPGRLMTLTGVPKSDYTRRLGPPVRISQRGNPIYDLTRKQDLFDTVVEVLDAENGRLLYSRRLEAYLIGFADDNHIYGYRLDDGDIPRIDIMRVRFNDN